MDDDSLNFGSPAAATPNSNSILAQPPLLSEDMISSGQDNHTGQGEGVIGDGRVLLLLTRSHELNHSLLRYHHGGRRR
jgi:hypothetical protein